MSANDLLIWMSARAEGSWQQFRTAVERFHVGDEADDMGNDVEDATASDLPVYQSARLALERLAHAEFASVPNGRRWRVVPPTLALTRTGDECVGILCGARYPGLCTSLSQLSGNVHLQLHPAPGVPDRVSVMCPEIALLDRAGRELGFHVQRNAPARLLAAIPPVGDSRSWLPSQPPATPGWTIHQFSTTNLGWRQADGLRVRTEAFGLFRFQLRHQRFYFLRWQERTFQIPVQVGKFLILRRRHVRRVVWHDPGQALLSVPVSCRPPLLIERALVLCSGQLPRLSTPTGRLQYGHVTPAIARMAAALLSQEVHHP